MELFWQWLKEIPNEDVKQIKLHQPTLVVDISFKVEHSHPSLLGVCLLVLFILFIPKQLK